jgi:hypothetical protein
MPFSSSSRSQGGPDASFGSRELSIIHDGL